MAKSTKGPFLAVDPTASPKVQAANAKAANLDTRPSKGPVVAHVVPTAPAHGATDKAPHTKRAVAQSKEAQRLTDAIAKIAEALAAHNATKTKTKPTGSVASFAVLQNAQKALAAVKREQETPEERQAREAAKTPTAKAKAPAKTPTAKVNRTITKGPVEYTNQKGGWTLYMVTLTLKHKDTDSATAAHKAGAAKAGQRAEMPLDFKWMNAKGYIILS